MARMTPEPENPYEAPSWDARAVDEPISIPPSFAGKLALAFHLYFTTFPLIAVLALSVWLPVSCYIQVWESENPNDFDYFGFQLAYMTEFVFGPPLAGAVLAVLGARLDGKRIGLWDAVRCGLGNWWPLFAARCWSGFFVLLGLIAFIVPGVFLMVRYILVEPVVVFEGAGAERARLRSQDLVRGRGVEVFLAGLMYLSVYIVLCIASAIIPGFYPEVDGLLFGLAFACSEVLLGMFFICWLLIYYWEHRRPAFATETIPGDAL